MKKILHILVLSLLFYNFSFADDWSEFYKPYQIDYKKDDVVFNKFAKDWNNFLKGMYNDSNCFETVPASLNKLTDVSDCYYRGIKRHMNRNDINTNQKVINAFYDYYEDIFQRAKMIQVNWVETTYRGGKVDVYSGMLDWSNQTNYLWKDTLSFSKEVWIKDATIQSSKFLKETTNKTTNTKNKINKKSDTIVKKLLKKLY